MKNKTKSTGQISDGYHTFDELYEHRNRLFIALAKLINKNVWRSKIHSDGTSYDNFFLLGIGKKNGEQITYHMPMTLWSETEFAETLEKAPKFDKHTSLDVLRRLKHLTRGNKKVQ